MAKQPFNPNIPTSIDSKATRIATGLWGGPVTTALQSGALGALAGRYAAAPIFSYLALPGADEIGEEELAKRKKRVKLLMTILGAMPGLTVGSLWGAEALRNQGWKGLFNGLKEPVPTEQPVTRPAPTNVEDLPPIGEPVDVEFQPTTGLESRASFDFSKITEFMQKDAWFMSNSDPIPAIPVGDTASLVYGDPFLRADQKDEFLGYLGEASNGGRRGLIQGRDLMRAGVGAGLGYAGANVATKIVGAVFGLPPTTKKTLRRIGMIAGALLGTGIIEP